MAAHGTGNCPSRGSSSSGPLGWEGKPQQGHQRGRWSSPGPCLPAQGSQCVRGYGHVGPRGGPRPPPQASSQLCRGCWREPRTEPQARPGRGRADNGLGPQSSDPAQSTPGPSQELCGTHRLPRPHLAPPMHLACRGGTALWPPSEPLPHHSLPPQPLWSGPGFPEDPSPCRPAKAE